MALTWLKHSVSARTDLKLMKLSLAQEAVFWHLLEYAAVQEVEGAFSDEDMEMLALEVARDDQDITASTIETLIRLKILERDVTPCNALQIDATLQGHVLRFTNWEKWQTRKPSDNPERIKERVHKHRNKCETPCNALQDDVTPVTPIDKTRQDKTNTPPNPPQAGGETEAEPERNRSERGQRGTRIPDNFRPAGQWEWARKTFPGITPEDLVSATEEFSDYWRAVPGAKGVKVDWIATWRNSLRRMDDQGRLRKRSGGNGNAAGVSRDDGPRLADPEEFLRQQREQEARQRTVIHAPALPAAGGDAAARYAA